MIKISLEPTETDEPQNVNKDFTVLKCIYVESVEKKLTYTFEISPHVKIDEFKKQISNNTDIPFDKLTLSYNDLTLNDGTLADYEIKKV
eukprot:UN03657